MSLEMVFSSLLNIRAFLSRHIVQQTRVTSDFIPFAFTEFTPPDSARNQSCIGAPALHRAPLNLSDEVQRLTAVQIVLVTVHS
jgi:hypothetical protein